MPARIDADTHLFEPLDLWATHVDPADRHLALAVAPDAAGNPWLVHGDRRLSPVVVHRPGDVAAMGAQVKRIREGGPPETPYEDELPRDFWDPAARLERMDEWGLDASVVFPNFGLLWERHLEDRPAALLANMRAWNRHAADVATAGKGRLHPVAHVSLRDLDWLDAELDTLAAAGVRLAMVAPALVDGRPLSHPDLDRAWASFVDHRVTPVFHVAAFPNPFHEAWYGEDVDLTSPVLTSVFLWAAPALAIADLALGGVFERHPGLRLGVMELSAIWVPMFLLMVDGGLDFHDRFNGLERALPLKPSEYVRRQVRVAAFCYEQPARLIRQAGEDLFMFSSDYPHAEGIARPVVDFDLVAGEIPGRAGEQLHAGNVAWLLGLE